MKYPSKIQVIAVFLAATMLLSVGLAGADPVTEPVTDNLNTGEWDEEETAPNPVISLDVTTSAQDLSEGTSDEAIAGYEDDSGDWVAGSETPFVVNTTMDIDNGDNVNPYTFAPGHIEDSSHQAFPDGHDEDDDWLNSSSAVWEVGSDDPSGNLTVSETSVATGVDAIRFDTGTSGDSGVADGDVMYEVRYNQTGDLAVDTDESKRVLQIGGDVDTLEANTELQIRLYDESGSYKEVVANTSKTAFEDNVFADSTGAFAYQIKLNKLTTQGTDSTWDNIESVRVRTVADGTSNADTNIALAWLDIRKKGKNTLGEKRATTDNDGNDGDSDSEYDEFQTIYNASGDISVHSMDSLDSEYDDAVIHDLTYPARYEASGLDQKGEDGQYVIYWDEPQNPQFDHTLNVTYEMELPGVIDLSYTNSPEVRMTQKWSDNRYLTFETADGVSDSTNLSDASFGSPAESLASKGDSIAIDSTGVTAGERILVHYELELTDDERTNNVEASGADDGDGGAGPAPGDGGDLWDRIVDFFRSIPGMITLLVGGFLSFRWWRNN